MKILLISHNCFLSCSNMGKTLCSLFSEFPREEICQLYIYPALPDVDMCHSYYRVTDKDVLRGYFTPGRPGGPLHMDALTFDQPQEFENRKDARLYRRPANSTPLAMLLRDAMWKLGRWNTPQLHRWIQEEQPDRIVLAPGYAKFLYDIALKISRKYHLPIVAYLCDDYYFVEQPRSLLGRVQLGMLRRKMNTLFSKTQAIVGISPELCQRYGATFHIPAQVIMTGAQLDRIPRKKAAGDKVFSYIGSLRPLRQEPLAQLGQALAQLNREDGTNHRLRVYTSEADPGMLDLLKREPAIELKGFVTGKALMQAYGESDYLIHVESFRRETADRTKFSLSTKIADSLASGIPVVAYGPASIASIAHLRRNDCAFVATQPEGLIPTLRQALQEEAQRRILENSVATVAACHNRAENSRRLYGILRDVTERESL